MRHDCCVSPLKNTPKFNIKLSKAQILLHTFVCVMGQEVLPCCRLAYISKYATLTCSIAVDSLRVRRLLCAYLFSFGKNISLFFLGEMRFSSPFKIFQILDLP